MLPGPVTPILSRRLLSPTSRGPVTSNVVDEEIVAGGYDDQGGRCQRLVYVAQLPSRVFQIGTHRLHAQLQPKGENPPAPPAEGNHPLGEYQISGCNLRSVLG